jgi:hypothetical protein
VSRVCVLSVGSLYLRPSAQSGSHETPQQKSTASNENATSKVSDQQQQDSAGNHRGADGISLPWPRSHEALLDKRSLAVVHFRSLRGLTIFRMCTLILIQLGLGADLDQVICSARKPFLGDRMALSTSFSP